jgi:multidrug efflux pump subunit AcrA (membrane-fusion protein)
VEIDITNAQGRLRPGMYAYVDLLVSQKADALVVPKAAVLTKEGATFCLAVDLAGKVVRHAIKTGLKAGSDVEVLEGLTESDEIISANAAAFQEGQTVERVTAK